MTERIPSPQADPAEIARMLARIVGDPWPAGTVVELRCPKTPKAVVSGYYDAAAPLIRDAARWSGLAETVYITLNDVLRDLLARSCNRARPFAKHTTGDQDITRRRWFLVDCDPVRPAGISSTEAEHLAALYRAREVRDWLRSSLGWPWPIYADSGNGAHLLYRLDLPNEDAVTERLKSCLAALAERFDDDRVTIDQTTYNASRISKVYGTAACKGDSVPDLGRVHRLARLLEVPDRLEVVGLPGGAL